MVHVLLLEDSTHIHRVVNLILGNSPHVKVEIASTPQQAHATLGYLQPDLIICSGQFFGPQTAQMLNQICSTVQMSHPNCSVLVLLGSGDKPEYFRNEGIDHLIKKPFTSEDLGEAVGKILGLNPLKSETHEAPPPVPQHPSPSPFDIDDLDFRLQGSISGHLDENTPQSTRYRSNQPVVTLDLKNLGPVHDTSSYNMGSPPPLPKTTVKAPIRDFEFSLAIEDTPKPDHAQEPITPLSPDRENENPWAIDPVPPKNFEPPIEEIKTHGSKPHGGPFFEDVFSTPDKQDTKVHHSQAGQAQLIQTLVDDALLRALDRAIPARIDRKIDLEWDKFIQDAVTKLGPHVENAMEQKIKEWTQKEFKMILKEAVLHELKIILDKISA